MNNLQALIARMDAIEAKTITEAEDPAAVIAKYTDKPELPAFIDSKDGKVKYMDNANATMGQEPQAKVMPSDWIKRYAPDLADALAAQGGDKAAYGAQDQSNFLGMQFNNGTKVNTKQAGADATSATFVKDMVAKITPLLDKIEKKGAAASPAATAGTAAQEGLNFTSGIAKVLAESLGYKLNEAEADPDMAELDKLMSQVADIEDPALKPLQDRYAALKNAPAAGQAATPAPGGEQGTIDPNKLTRLKALLDKLAASKGGLKESKLPVSEAEKYAALRDRLEQIQSRVDEGPLDLLKGAYNVGKNFVGGLGGKMAQGTAKSASELATGQAATNAARVAAGRKALSPAQLAQQAKAGIGTTNAATGAAKFANKAGTVVAKNPGKTAVGAAALGGAAGYGLSGGPETPATPTATPAPGGAGAGGGKGPAAPAAPATGFTPEEQTELDALVKELEPNMGRSPELDALLLQHKKLAGGGSAAPAAPAAPSNAAAAIDPITANAKPKSESMDSLRRLAGL